jgi:two-component system alkaline phosphatase synthesis response regulator PhoP
MKEKILIVDDEQPIVTLLEFNLEQSGFVVLSANNGREAVEIVMREHPDLIILDVMLPELDGLEVCKVLRQNKVNTPILMLTAKNDEFDKIIGLELGADDYLTKPFSPREVVARVRAILRRVNREASDKEEHDKIVIGKLEIHSKKYEAFYDGKHLDLTPKEFELLHYLTINNGHVLSREKLLEAIWNYDYYGETRIVDVHISHLRDKINPTYIKTVRGIGYKLDGQDKND